MTAQLSPATLAVCTFAVVFVGFAGGVAMATAFARPAATAPIVDRDAWRETAPAKPVSFTQTPQPRCSPWEISDAAMEEVLDQMIRRGWRAPTQGAAMALLETQQPGAIEAIDPDAPMPPRRVWRSPTSDNISDEPAGEEASQEAAPEPQPADVEIKDPPPS